MELDMRQLARLKMSKFFKPRMQNVSLSLVFCCSWFLVSCNHTKPLIAIQFRYVYWFFKIVEATDFLKLHASEIDIKKASIKLADGSGLFCSFKNTFVFTHFFLPSSVQRCCGIFCFFVIICDLVCFERSTESCLGRETW